jgi:MoaA/NifB/PqqE/SkfB family radical SAM enzyme
MNEMNPELLRERMAARYAAPLPPMVVLDVTNTCNLKCIHCPQPLLQARPDFKPLHLKWEHFKKIADEIAEVDQPILLRIAGDGEPLIHPQLVEMVEYAKANTKAVVNVTTNGLILDQEKADRLLKAGVDLVDFSIDGFSKRVGGKYERLLANIFRFLDRRAALRANTKMMVSFIAQKENQEEAEPFRAFWSQFADRVLVRQLHSAVGQVKVEESTERNAAGGRARFPCPHLWKRLTIDFRGQIKYCAHDWVYDEGVTIGRIEDNGLREVWSGERLAALRRNHTSGDYPEGEVCTTCTDWASTRWDMGYERLIDRVVYREPTLVTELELDDD